MKERGREDLGWETAEEGRGRCAILKGPLGCLLPSPFPPHPSSSFPPPSPPSFATHCPGEQGDLHDEPVHARDHTGAQDSEGLHSHGPPLRMPPGPCLHLWREVRLPSSRSRHRLRPLAPGGAAGAFSDFLGTVRGRGGREGGENCVAVQVRSACLRRSVCVLGCPPPFPLPSLPPFRLFLSSPSSLPILNVAPPLPIPNAMPWP